MIYDMIMQNPFFSYETDESKYDDKLSVFVHRLEYQRSLYNWVYYGEVKDNLPNGRGIAISEAPIAVLKGHFENGD